MKTNCIKYIGVAILLATATMAFAKGGVIYTGELAKHVKGYSGPTPLKITVEKGKITVEKGKITKIEAETSKESPRYYRMAQKKVFPQYIGKTVDELFNLKPDGATGATYSSKAIVENIKFGLSNYKKSAKSTSTKKSKKKR